MTPTDSLIIYPTMKLSNTMEASLFIFTVRKKAQGFIQGVRRSGKPQ